MCNEFLFPEIAQQEPCQEESGLISDKMRNTNPRALFRSAAPREAGCQPQDLRDLGLSVGEPSGEGAGVGTVAVLLAEEELVLLWLTRQRRGFWTSCRGF